jgi:hypothetical protein
MPPLPLPFDFSDVEEVIMRAAGKFGVEGDLLGVASLICSDELASLPSFPDVWGVLGTDNKLSVLFESVYG